MHDNLLKNHSIHINTSRRNIGGNEERLYFLHKPMLYTHLTFKSASEALFRQKIIEYKNVMITGLLYINKSVYKLGLLMCRKGQMRKWLYLQLRCDSKATLLAYVNQRKPKSIIGLLKAAFKEKQEWKKWKQPIWKRTR